MMAESRMQLDVVVIGAGPAGLVAAIRLLQFGHKVALVESSPFPRSQVGESLSPGIVGLLDFIGLGDILDSRAFIAGLPSIVAWDAPEPISRSSAEKGGGWMVDRGLFDAKILEAAKAMGLVVFQPAKISQKIRLEGKWQLELTNGHSLEAAWLVDARGRKAVPSQKRILASPPNLGIWSDEVQGDFPRATCIEAMEGGWIWASPLCNGSQRLMAFVDANSLKASKPAAVWERMMLGSEILKLGSLSFSEKGLQSCVVANYCHAEPWQDGILRVGEAAFSLDPLSSTGVEKAMRFALQTAIALNTILKSGRIDLARQFHEEKLLDAVATHSVWTASFYAQAWPKAAFWLDRSRPLAATGNPRNALAEKIFQRMGLLERQTAKPPADGQASIMQNWDRAAAWSPQLVWRPHACVVGEQLAEEMALFHPDLARPVAYLGEKSLWELHQLRSSGGTLAEFVHGWSKVMAPELSMKVLGKLLQDSLLLWEDQG